MRKRFRDPDPDGAPDKKKFPTERDLAILRRLDLRRFVASNWLRHFVGGEYTAFASRLGQLFDGGYIKRQDEYLHPDTVHARHIVYSLTDKGRKVLDDLGYPRVHASTKQYLHEFLGSLVMDSIEIGAEQLGFQFVGWDTLQHDERVPARHLKNPFSVKLGDKNLRFDGTPFVLKNPDPNKDDKYIPGFEWDRNTEPLRSYDTREKWGDKLLAIKEFMQRRVYTTHYGFENAIIPVVTTNATHMLNIMGLAKEICGSNNYLRFKAVPDWPKARNFPAPNGDMLKEPWHTLDARELFLYE